MLTVDVQIDFKGYQLSTQLDIQPGKTVGLYGKSGIGKSTLLKVIAGLQHPSSGRVSFDQTVWNDTPHKTFVPPQKRSIGMVFQDFALFPNLSVMENLKFAQRNSDQELATLVDTFDIRDILDQSPNEISGGQKQRVAIGRALCYNPKVLLMDEPFAALDDEIKESIKILLRSYITDHKKTALIASHDIQDLAFFTDDIIKLGHH